MMLSKHNESTKSNLKPHVSSGFTSSDSHQLVDIQTRCFYEVVYTIL